MFPKARQDQIVVEEMADEILVYDLERKKAHCLNATAGLVWRNCDGAHSLSGLADILRQELHLPDADKVAQLAVEQLSRRRLLEQAIAPLADADRFSRRDALRKLAVTGIALPLVMTVTARPASAQGSILVAARKCGEPCIPSSINPCESQCICCNGVCVPESNTQCGSDCRDCTATGEICMFGGCFSQR